MPKYILFTILATLSVQAIEKADLVVVEKSGSILYLKKENRIIGQYPVSFGAEPTGHKGQEGDERTPEGNYTLDYKNAASSYHRSIHISYPNAEDRKRAAQKGVSPGGDIMIHGQKNGFGWLSWLVQRFDWTDGCIAVSDEDMDEIWESVAAGTPIEILP